MPEPDEDHYCRPQKPNWVDIGTLAVLSLTLAAVIVYACEAHRQNVALNNSVKQQAMINRPVIIGSGVAVETSTNGIPTKVVVTIVNFGRSTAPLMTAVGHIFVSDAGEPAPVDPQCKEGSSWPRGNRLTALVPYNSALAPTGITRWEWTPAEGQNVTEASNDKPLFIVGCIYYKGLDDSGYFSDFCVSWAGGNNFPVCTDSSRNYIH